MKRVCLLALASLLVVALPLAAWFVVEVPQPVYADNISITISSITINFDTVTPPVTRQGATGQSDGNPAITITIESDTTVAVDVGIMGTIKEGDLSLTNWEYSTAFESGYTALNNFYVGVYFDQGPSGTDIELPFYHWITVPEGTTAGYHEVEVSYKAIDASGSF